jgi:hypothetical protein
MARRHRLERLKQARDVSRRNRRPLVLHLDDDVVALPARPQLNAPLG